MTFFSEEISLVALKNIANLSTKLTAADQILSGEIKGKFTNYLLLIAAIV
jgi:hypothetical protein